jgi:hypothetical protein
MPLTSSNCSGSVLTVLHHHSQPIRSLQELGSNSYLPCIILFSQKNSTQTSEDRMCRKKEWCSPPYPSPSRFRLFIHYEVNLGPVALIGVFQFSGRVALISVVFVRSLFDQNSVRKYFLPFRRAALIWRRDEWFGELVTILAAKAMSAIGCAGPPTPCKLRMYRALAARADVPRSRP